MKVGEVYESRRCGKLEILEYNGIDNVVVKFQNTGQVYTFYKQAIQKGTVADRMHPSVAGKGYIGIGEYKSSQNKKLVKAYMTWTHMLTRCYDPEKWHNAYRGCTVSEEWHNYQNFARWYEANKIEGWELDKDFCKLGNKCYSSDFCTFIPQEVNTFAPRNVHGNFKGYTVTRGGKFMTQIRSSRFGDYRKSFDTASEAYADYCRVKNLDARLLAEKWRDELDTRVYTNLMNFDTDLYIRSF